MIYLSKEQILNLHKNLIDKFGGSHGIRDEKLFDQSYHSILQTYDGHDLYPSVLHKIAHISYSLITSHTFIDGNKRIATHLMLVLLELNKIHITYNDKDLIQIIMELASGKKDEDALLKWIVSRVKKS